MHQFKGIVGGEGWRACRPFVEDAAEGVEIAAGAEGIGEASSLFGRAITQQFGWIGSGVGGPDADDAAVGVTDEGARQERTVDRAGVVKLPKECGGLAGITEKSLWLGVH
jgi:hypothetical protein